MQSNSEAIEAGIKRNSSREYLIVLRKRWLLIFSVIGLFLLITVFITLTTKQIYSASCQVLLEKNYGKPGLESSYYTYEPDFLETQAEIIKSENVAGKVVEKLNLSTKYKDYFLEDSKNDDTFLAPLLNKCRHFFVIFRQLLIGSNSVSARKPDDALPTVENKSDEEIIASEIRAGLTVLPVRTTKIVSISYQDDDPGMAKMVVDAVVKAYMDEMLDIKLSTSSYSLKWMTAKASEERDKLERSERDLQKFVRENDLVTVENKLTVLPQRLTDFASQLSKAETEKKELQDQLDQITLLKNNGDELEKLPLFSTNEVLRDLREKIYKSNQNIMELSQKYGGRHPMMIKARDELNSLKEERKFEISRIVSTVKNSLALAVSKQRSLQDLLESTKDETLDLNEKFVQYSIMKREVDSNRVLYDTLQASIKQQGVTEQSQSVNIWVIKQASFPATPIKPNKKVNLIVGLFLGLVCGVTLVFFIEFLDNTLSTVSQIEDNFGLTVLGSISELKGREKNADNYVLYNPLSPIAECYRLIRSAILLSSAGHPPQVMLITSMNKSEGKTVTGTNLARMLVQDKKSVVIIDCDLRRPRMDSLLNMKNHTGLSTYLAGNVEECPLYMVEDENISLIPAGQRPPNPSELLNSSRMKELIDELRSRFDFILLDSPPIGAVTDSLTLSRYVDGTILVVRAGKTSIDMFASGVRKLQELRARILGVVLNGVKVRDHNAYQYGYTTYYAREDD